MSLFAVNGEIAVAVVYNVSSWSADVNVLAYRDCVEDIRHGSSRLVFIGEVGLDRQIKRFGVFLVLAALVLILLVISTPIHLPLLVWQNWPSRSIRPNQHLIPHMNGNFNMLTIPEPQVLGVRGQLKRVPSSIVTDFLAFDQFDACPSVLFQCLVAVIFGAFIVFLLQFFC